MDKENFKEIAGKRSGLYCLFLSAGLLCLAFIALRFGVIENDLLPRSCGSGGSDSGLSCGLTWILTQSFQAQRLGIFALAFGVLGFLSGNRLCGWIGWLAGVVGLVLYSSDYASVGALLGLFTLLRSYAPSLAAGEGTDNTQKNRMSGGVGEVTGRISSPRPD